MPVRLLQFQRHLLLGPEQLRPPKRIFGEPPRKVSCLFESRFTDHLSANQKSSGIDGGISHEKSASRQEIKHWRDARLSVPTPVELPTTGLIGS